VDRPDPTFPFDADPDRRDPDRPDQIRKNKADPDPQHTENKLAENKTKAKGIRIDDEGKRITGEGNWREKDKTEKGGKQTIRLEADAIIGLRWKQDK
jgi:hypothetical protein